MIGIEQAGIAETMDFVLKKFSPESQNKLAQVSMLYTIILLKIHCLMCKNVDRNVDHKH